MTGIERMNASFEFLAVLLAVMGHRRKGGVSKSRVGEILGLGASSLLDDLLSQGLIYSDPSRELNFWRPTPSTLLALGFRSYTDIPALKELEEWFETEKEISAIAKLDRTMDSFYSEHCLGESRNRRNFVSSNSS
jgi:hypothetical protein